MAQRKEITRRQWIITGIVVFAIIAAAGGFIYWYTTSQSVYIDSASIKAPEIDLSPSQPGTLENVYVNEGDTVPENFTVARVGDQLIQTTVAGIVISVPDTVGAQVSPGQTVVAMIDPTQLRVVGEIDENKGLSLIKVGDPVTFTVDAFGSQQFSGVVDEIAPTSNASGVVFNISDSRQTQQFDVKARFDTTAYPQLKNGMSARMWVYQQ
ncbi:MAG TPA: efflux RND transporter periplasmic adaptor subunit [Candidatus Paceibacterota bacterium]|jgi:multidrug resistance efflux pump|nr:efflux RND transporter periplasmic adaptor subunit [Candidatus Paceibacterota bacterium]